MHLGDEMPDVCTLALYLINLEGDVSQPSVISETRCFQWPFLELVSNIV